MHMWPNNNAYPCCIWDSDQPLGAFSDKVGLQDLWNSEKMRELRVNMLADKPTDGCKRCYTLEEGGDLWTLRKVSLLDYPHHSDLVDKTQADGTVPEMRMAYLDIRFSNLCNLRCHTCGPELSSAWYEDQTTLFGAPSHAKNLQVGPEEKFWNELEPLLDTVEKAYFAGGEPLICDEQYRILDYWIEKKKFNIPINYTTNFALLTHKKARILDYWKQFPNVSVSASLDDSGPRAEYLRKGTNWDNIVRNRQLMMQECPNIHFEITPTISAYNVYHFPEFHWEWIQLGLIEPNNVRLNILTHQAFMSVRILPIEYKIRIKEKYEKYLAMIQEHAWKQNKHVWQIESAYKSLITFMMAADESHHLREFFQRISKVDAAREERIFAVYPELKFAWLCMK